MKRSIRTRAPENLERRFLGRKPLGEPFGATAAVLDLALGVDPAEVAVSVRAKRLAHVVDVDEIDPDPNCRRGRHCGGI